MPIKWFREREGGNADAEMARERVLDKLGAKMKDAVTDGSSTMLICETNQGDVVVSIDRYNKRKKRWTFGVRYPKYLKIK